MLTRSNYEEIQAAIRQATEAVETCHPGPDTRGILADFVAGLADAFSQGNESFDHNRFFNGADYPELVNDYLVNQVLDRYMAGATIRDLAAEHHITPAALADRLRAAGVQIRHGGPRPGTPKSPCKEPPTEEELQQMVARYEAGATLAMVGSEFGYHASTVAEHIRPFVAIRGRRRTG